MGRICFGVSIARCAGGNGIAPSGEVSPSRGARVGEQSIARCAGGRAVHRAVRRWKLCAGGWWASLHRAVRRWSVGPVWFHSFLRGRGGSLPRAVGRICFGVSIARCAFYFPHWPRLSRTQQVDSNLFLQMQNEGAIQHGKEVAPADMYLCGRDLRTPCALMHFARPPRVADPK